MQKTETVSQSHKNASELNLDETMEIIKTFREQTPSSKWSTEDIVGLIVSTPDDGRDLVKSLCQTHKFITILDRLSAKNRANALELIDALSANDREKANAIYAESGYEPPEELL